MLRIPKGFYKNCLEEMSQVVLIIVIALNIRATRRPATSLHGDVLIYITETFPSTVLECTGHMYICCSFF